MRHAAQLWSVVLALAIPLLHAAPAEASDTYPAIVQEELDMPCAPPCTICHNTSAGGEGTVTRDFGIAMRSRGLDDNDEDCVPKALRALESGMTGNACRGLANTEGVPADSDEDGTPDITELREGNDPNSPSPGASVCVLKYGCGARVAPDPRPVAVAGLFGLGTLIWFGRRRKRASRNRAR